MGTFKNTLIRFSFFVVLFAKAQIGISQVNLVKNPSFEDTISCPNSGGQVWKAEYWNSLWYTPDYFNTCNPYWQFSIPYNVFGYQYPNTGNAYMGMAIYASESPSIREIIGSSFTSSLIVGQKYFINLKVCLGWNATYSANLATNKIGVLFSTVDYLLNPPPIANYCQIYSDSIISDSINWTTIRGSFIADSAYSFLSISNFFDNANTDTMHFITSNVYHCYMYIDDVCISEDSLYTEVWTSLPSDNFKKKMDINIFPNPTYGNINIENIPFGCTEIEIYDVNGFLIKSISFNNISKLSINISSLMPGIYSLVFRKEKTIQIKNIIKF